MSRKIALMGMHLESNSFAPVSDEAAFRSLCYLAGDEMLDDLARENPRSAAELSGFHAEMTKLTGDWQPVPILVTSAEPGGPADPDCFVRTTEEMARRLSEAMPLDGVFFSAHGAMTSTESFDPDGELFEMVRAIVGPDVPFIATLDLHANISERMVDETDILISYVTNPHVDQRERAQEAAGLMVEMFDGMKPEAAFIRVPMTSPPVTLLTAAGPYADIIDYGQSAKTDVIANVSVLAGFAYGNTPKNGMAVIVTARGDSGAARALAADIAARAWDSRERFKVGLTSIDKAVLRAQASGENLTQPAVILADVADNPGGGGRGNTTWVLKALVEAEVQDCYFGIFHDPALAAAAHQRGLGAEFKARFNTETESEFSKPFEAEARVAGVHDGQCVGTLGIYAGRSLDLGPTALLEIGGVRVVVVSKRKQCADPVFFQMFGLEMERARSVVVKSRGHFRAGFLPWFPPEQVIEIDAPGLTSPVFDNFDFDGYTRPIYPLDPDMDWQAA
ncbi:MAG: M81 family metallopeptidase [Magnetovibrio sp.]|nr:M81 family metallopeptidase [Magnetovibrio sp.]